MSRYINEKPGSLLRRRLEAAASPHWFFWTSTAVRSLEPGFFCAHRVVEIVWCARRETPSWLKTLRRGGTSADGNTTLTRDAAIVVLN